MQRNVPIQIDLDDPVEIIQRIFLDRTIFLRTACGLAGAAADACTVHKDALLPVSRALGEASHDRLFICNIDLAIDAADFLGHRLAEFAIEIEQCDFHAFGSKRAGRRSAKT
jgi:hypothetical protein